MPDPISFESSTPRLGLPHLFAAQVQKEFIVNEAHARVDMLLHCAVEGEANAPPETPSEGEVWIVGDAPTGEWAGHTGQLAGRQAGAWLFAVPFAGMSAFDKAARQAVRYDAGWLRAAAPVLLDGGAVADAEARVAIGELVEVLRSAGILPVID